MFCAKSEENMNYWTHKLFAVNFKIQYLFHFKDKGNLEIYKGNNFQKLLKISIGNKVYSQTISF